MKKIYIWSILTLIITIFFPTALLAQKSTPTNGAGTTAQHETHMTSAYALDVGYAFMRTGEGSKGNGTKSGNLSKQAMQLVYTGQAYDSLTGTTTDCYYVFALQPKGFVIVAADDRVEPILGYSYDNNFVVEGMPDHVRGWLSNYERQIEAVAKNDLQPEPATQTKWTRLKSGQSMSTRSGESVGPLITTEWGQTGVYGSLCPNGNVGCVGVAMAQVMNYWQYPGKGVGHIDYSGNEVFFNETTYNWDSLYIIPNALPTLMYHAAMGSWSKFCSGSTGSTIDAARIGMATFFDYDTSSYFANENDYFNYQWLSMIKTNLDDSIPVLYRGDISSGGGHAWVCDGYDENDMFHMNWGWEGLDNGWFLLNALSAGGWDMTGGGAVFDLVPKHSPLQAKFEYALADTTIRLAYFYDFSKNAPEVYYWDFGDGSSSTLKNPTHQYDTVGTYTVNLTVNKSGETSLFSQIIEIKENHYLVEVTSNLSSLTGSGIAVDYDMDGLQDLLWFESDEFLLLKNCDSISPLGFSFNKTAEFPNCAYTSNFTHKAQVVDFSNTNTPSVLYWGVNYPYAQWHYLKNNENLLVNDTTFRPVFLRERVWSEIVEDYWNLTKSFVVLDYNNDGLMDITIGNVIYQNIGGDMFIGIDTIFHHSVDSWTDIDKDGDVDVLSEGGVYINDGNGNFQFIHNPFGAVDDFDGDGDIEMISYGLVNSNINTSYVYEMNANKTFVVKDSLINSIDFEFDTDETMIATAFYSTHADMDNDGIMDIIGSHIEVEEGCVFNYDGDTVTCKDLNVNLGVRTGVWIDYNTDGSIDMIRGKEVRGDPRTFLYKNIHPNNLPPTAPTNLSAETSGNTAYLHWNASADDHTYSGSLTYNIAVGSAPDSCDIYSPLSNLITGKRYTVNKGNAGMGTVWRINDLPNGTYYWRVQAIDQGFAASSFSEMGTFTISGNNLPPAMAPIAKDCYMNKPNTLSRDEFLAHYYDRDNDTLQSVMITQLPNQGTLFLNDNAVMEGQIISSLDLGQLYYMTTNLGDDAFQLKPFDGTDYSDYETTISFHTTIFEPVLKFDDISGDVVWGDYNNDGNLDFATIWGIYKNENNSFAQILDTVPAAERVYWADVNNDGMLDAIFSETVLLNAGNDSFVWQTALNNQDGELSGMADANNDNKVDYLITSLDESLASLYFNTGNGFVEDSSYNNIPTYRDGSLMFADYDNDGRSDFAITGWSDNGKETSLYRNNGASFDKIGIVLPKWGTGSLDWGDYDNDGDLDLIVCGYNGDGYETAIYNNDHGTMSLVTTESLPGIMRGQVKWMDYNNDGLLDVLLVGYDDNTVCYLYKNTGYLSFLQIPIDQIGISPLWFSNVSIADFDGDGYQDVLLSGVDQDRKSHTYIYRNSYGTPTSSINTAPNVPSNLQSDVTGNSVHLVWNKSTDNTTSQASVAYNVYIRNENNDTFVVSPLSDLQTGFHKVVDRGNCGSNNFMNVNSLDAGTYYWSVQAIDNGLMTSDFAPEQSFTITCELSITEIYDTVPCVYFWNNQYFLNSTTITGHFSTSEGCDSTVIIHMQVVQDSCWNPIYVTETGAGLHNGSSWENAIGDLQKAIDLAALHGSSVWVKEGTYKGDIIQENAFNVYNGVSLYGGFVGNEPSDFDIDQRVPMSHPSILDGQNTQRVLNSTDIGVNTLHYIDGFVIQNGSSEWHPGALLGDYSVLSNSLIRNNVCGESQQVVHGVIQGGVVVNSIITRNKVYWADIRESIVINCVFANNFGYLCNPTLNSLVRNCIVLDNVCDTWGYDFWGARRSTLNCAIASNAAPEGNMVISSENDGSEPGVNYVRFVDPDNDDYRLLPGSACIDAGSLEESELFDMYLPSVDIQGWPRILNGMIDMGAYEYYAIPTVETFDTICEGEIYTFHDTVYSTTGVYSHHIHQNPTMDTLFVLYLQVNPSYFVEMPIHLSDSGVFYDGQIYGKPGVYQFDYLTEQGCDSIVNLILYEEQLSLCKNDLPYQYGDTVFEENTVNGLYSVNQNGQSLSLYVTINLAYNIYDTMVVCENWHYNVGSDFVYDPISNDYILSTQTVNGCDSIIHRHVIINPSYYLHYHDTIPSGVGYFANGFYAPADETYNRQYWTQANYLKTDCGCDSVRFLQLTITGAPMRYVTTTGTGDGTSWANATSDLQAAIDEMEPLKGNVWVAQGTYYGDSVSERAFLLKNNVYVFGGFAGDEPDDFDISLRDLSTYPSILDGLNSQRTVEKTYSFSSNPIYAVLDGFTVQNGNAGYGNGGNIYGWWEAIIRNCIIRNGNAANGAGAANAFLENCVVYNNRGNNWSGGISGCTAENCTFVNNIGSVSVANQSTLTNCILWNNGGFDHSIGNTILYSAIDGQEIDDNGNILLAHNNDGFSPDSNYVRFVDPENDDFRLVCGSACINVGTPDISELGLPTVDLQGLPRVLDGRIDMGAYEYYPVPVVETYDTICENGSVVFFNSVYNTAGRYVHHSSNNVTLDTLHVLYLTTFASDSVEIFETACDTYEWNGEIYTESNTYIQTLANHNGCDSVVSLHLVILNSTHNVEDITACNLFEWNGVTYTETGVYTYAYENSDGCSSVDTIYLTVNQPTTGTDVQTVCGSYTWIDGITYTESNNTATFTLTNAAGCDSVVTLNLTINQPTTGTDVQIACGSFTWIDGITYTESNNTATYTLTNAVGCDSVVTLNLTLNHSDTVEFAETVCESFEWDGETFTTSGDYTRTLINIAGCDSVVTLHLTVNQSVATDEYLTICENELPYAYGDTVFEIGTPELSIIHFQLSTVDGCDSVVTLHLTISPSEETEFSITIPDSCYIWNGQDYCISGDYIQTLQTVHGCDSVVTLHLTITVGIEDHDLGASITVYPNPTSGIINVQCTMNNVQAETVEIRLCDAYGKLVNVVSANNDGITQIDLSRFAPGIYLLKAVADGNVVAVRKVVKR